jgi:hypothetical protein
MVRLRKQGTVPRGPPPYSLLPCSNVSEHQRGKSRAVANLYDTLALPSLGRQNGPPLRRRQSVHAHKQDGCFTIDPGSLAVTPLGHCTSCDHTLSLPLSTETLAAALCRPQARGRQTTAASHPPFRCIIALEGLGMAWACATLVPSA